MHVFLSPLDTCVSQVHLQTSAVQCLDLHLAETHWRPQLRHLSCEFVLSVTPFTLRACAGTNCTGLGALCFPFLLSWIIPACIPLYLTDPPLDSRGVCANFPPKSLSQGYMSPVFCPSP